MKKENGKSLLIIVVLIGAFIMLMQMQTPTGAATYNKQVSVRWTTYYGQEKSLDHILNLREAIVRKSGSQCEFVETDQGFNFRLAGQVSTTERNGNPFIRNDYCIDSETLMEYTCGASIDYKRKSDTDWQHRNDIAAGFAIKCKEFYGSNSVCSNGACTPEPVTSQSFATIPDNIALAINDVHTGLFSSARHGILGIHDITQSPPALIKTISIADNALLGRIAAAGHLLYVPGNYQVSATEAGPPLLFVVDPRTDAIQEIPFPDDIGNDGLNLWGDVLYVPEKNRVYAVHPDSNYMFIGDLTAGTSRFFYIGENTTMTGYRLAVSPEKDRLYILGNHFREFEKKGYTHLNIFDIATEKIIKVTPLYQLQDFRTVTHLFTNYDGHVHVIFTLQGCYGCPFTEDFTYTRDGGDGQNDGVFLYPLQFSYVSPVIAFHPNWGDYILTHREVFDRWAIVTFGLYPIYSIPPPGDAGSDYVLFESGATAYVSYQGASEMQQITGFNP